jgi:hypothetical protein
MGAGIFIAAVGRPAHAQPSCDGVRLDLADDLSPTWREAGIRLRSELAASEAPCVSATLLVENASNGGARLSATTPDGRHTERVLTKVSALSPTAMGIVASLPPDPPAPTVESQSPREHFTSAIEEPTADDVSENAARNRAAASPQLWLGASAGPRIGAPTMLGMLDIEGHAYFEMDNWLVAASLRFGTSLGESAVAADDSYYEIVGSLGAGRRFQIGASSLDVLLSPEIASASLADNDDGYEGVPPGVARTEARVGASIGWWTSFRDESRIGISVDSDIAPYGLLHGVRSAQTEPPIPAWTASLQLSVAGRVL